MKYIAIIFIMLMAVGFVSCSDDFLESDSTEFISGDKLTDTRPVNPDIFDGLIRGIYSLMVNTGSGGTDLDHDDFGQKSYEIYMDMLSGDMILAGYNYGWYSDVAKMASTVNYRDNNNYKPWRYYYRIIAASNVIIDELGGNEATPESDDGKQQMGQAKAMRAHSYFYLINLFSNNVNSGQKVLPIYTLVDQPAQGLSTTTDVWNLIRKDLEDAELLLAGVKQNYIFEVDENVAKGLLAYTYLTIGEFGLAATKAQEVIDAGYKIIPSEFVAGGTNIPRNPYSYFDGQGANWLWGFDITLDQGLDLVSWWGQVDVFTYSYSWAGDPKLIDEGLFNSLPDYDLRKKQFDEDGYPAFKFYYEKADASDWRTEGSQREITSDYVYMRIEEMHLIKSEALAFDNKDGESRDALKVLLKERISETTEPDPNDEDEVIVIKTVDENLEYIDALSGDVLKEEIRKQWRIEMWGEGKSYLALKRFKAEVYREGHIDFNEVAIPYDDDRLTFEIPYQEIQDNPHISK